MMIKIKCLLNYFIKLKNIIKIIYPYIIKIMIDIKCFIKLKNIIKFNKQYDYIIVLYKIKNQ